MSWKENKNRRIGWVGWRKRNERRNDTIILLMQKIKVI